MTQTTKNDRLHYQTLESLRLATIFSNLFHTFVCGAGWHPAADWKSACCGFLESFGRPIDNRPQVTNLPHICGEAALCHKLPHSHALNLFAPTENRVSRR